MKFGPFGQQHNHFTTAPVSQCMSHDLSHTNKANIKMPDNQDQEADI